MTPRALLTQLSAGRVALGALMLAAPPLATGRWVGKDGSRPGGRVMTRALGIRDGALGAVTLATMRSGQPLRTLVVAGIACDTTDLLATHAARESLPKGAAPMIYALAGAAIVVGLANLADSPAAAS